MSVKHSCLISLSLQNFRFPVYRMSFFTLLQDKISARIGMNGTIILFWECSSPEWKTCNPMNLIWTCNPKFFFSSANHNIIKSSEGRGEGWRQQWQLLIILDFYGALSPKSEALSLNIEKAVVKVVKAFKCSLWSITRGRRGTFHSTKFSGLPFWKFPAANHMFSTNIISGKENNLANIQISAYFLQEISVA